MLHITRVLINEFKITDTDFMGYEVCKASANFHHLIIPHRNNGVKNIANGAVLNKDVSHPYLHVIEFKDYDIFYDITREMMKENRMGKLDIECMRRIHQMLDTFEREHSGDTNFFGEQIIREEYVKRLKL